MRLLVAGHEVSTAEMARRFGVSAMTIRRDLQAIEEAGGAVRRYGGAIAARRITFEFAFDERHQQHLDEKRRIGQAAAELVEGGQTIFLDTGTTTLEVARAVARRGVRCSAVTSSLVIASELWGQATVELRLVGGRVREGSPDLVGPETALALEKLTADIAFVGSDGIDPARGCFAMDSETAQVAECMCRHARRVVVVADASKLGGAGAVRFLAIETMKELITDASADKSAVALLRKKGVKTTLA